MLQLRLFGAFELRAAGSPVLLTSTRAQSVLACLALRPGVPQRRDRVAHRLWPGSTDRQARTNLRHVLHTLRAAVPDAGHHLRATTQTLTLCEVATDVAAFDAARAGDDPATLRAAADLYAGDLLADSTEDWVTVERDEYRRRATAALGRLVALLEEAGDPDAVRYAERARTLEPLAEAPYQALLRLHAAQGDRARAVRVYHDCVATLEGELGVGPSAETRRLYEALLPATAPPRADGTTAFVGRGPQRRRLTELWWAAAGTPQLVVVTGEPGIGKTRLVEEFRQWAARHGALTASARSYAAEGALAYAPVAAWLRGLAPARRRGHLGPARLAALAALLPELGAEPAPADPGARLRLFDAAAHALTAAGAPVLLVADDLHAADPPTLQFLHYLLRGEAPGPLLVAATARLDETDPGDPVHTLLTGLHTLGRGTELPLDRLAPPETAALAARLGHRLAPAAAARLHVETAGIPLFVVEALRAGPVGGEPQVLTDRVRAVLDARLRQLGPGARELAGLAATAGSAVSVDVLARVHPVAEDLDELWRRRILVTAGGDTYDFSHEKLREVAYGSLPPARRRRNHGLIAEALGAVHGDDVAARVAAHLVEAGARADAVDWFLRGARAAQRLYAEAEAAALLLRAAELVRGHDRELDVLAAVPGPLSAAEGYASPNLRAVLDRAFALAGESGRPVAAPLLRAQAMAVLSRGDFAAAARYGTRLRALGDGDDVLAVEADFVRGVAAAWRDDNDAARAHLEAALARYDPANRARHLLAYGTDPRVLCLVRLAHVHFRLGDPAQARRLRAAALDAAHAAGHPFTHGAALLFAALLDLDLADDAALRGHVAELAGLRDRVDAPPVRLVTDALTGHLDVLAGATRPGLARIDAALADPAGGTAPGLPSMLLRIRLAAATAAGLADEARATAARLLAGGVRVWDADARAALDR